MDAIRAFVQTLLPFEFLQFDFMVNALLAILLLTPLQVSVAANRKKYDEVRRTSDMCEALRELMKEEIEEELKKSRDKAIQEGLAQGLEQGRINQLIDLVMQNLLPIETAAQCAKMTLDEFKVAMEKKEN